MAQLIQFKRRIPGTGAPGALDAGEPAVSITGAGVADLYIGDGGAVRTLVSAARQVEIAGPQTITGAKTIAVANLHITGGADGDILMTDGAGGLSWENPPTAATVGPTAPTVPPPRGGDLWFDGDVLHIYDGGTWTVVGFEEPTGAGVWGRTSAGAWALALPLAGGTLTGTLTVPTINVSTALNIAPNHLHISGGGAGDVLTTDGAGGMSWEPLDPGGLLSVNAVAPLSGNGTSGSALGVTPANVTQIEAGTNNVFPITSLGLRSQLGDDAADLDTTAKTVVPAINELKGDVDDLGTQLAAISGALRFVGNYDADDNEVVSAATGTLTVGQPLPAAAAANEGWYVIVTVAGTGTAPAPAVRMEVSDWIVSNGTQWIHVPLYHAAVTAAAVAVSPAVNAWNNVQAAIAGLYTLASNALTSVAVDGISIIGDGDATPLAVDIVDGGTY